MAESMDYSTEAQVRRISADFARRRARMFLAFACVEGPVLLGAIVVVYVLKLVDPQFGVWILLAVALLSGLCLSALVISHARAEQQAIRDVGGTPFPPSGGPTF
ncbi:hypothetical protein [Microbacterium azadirachtae]|uniref:Uncharacterized protein n=1 Tax=Microbacterium azadirachtae TaxID=582680 RepID=A0A1I6HQR4_9MICO|nr:hypothetical protein [Microbacterium azadirachtae]UXW85942.1 hypothetical protein NFX31_17340 [Microbacterium azadirachtae]SDL68127.1 hypothetical protein SAMN04488593_1560 [Microbacterium azadirachtae]SEF97573.1 hypothetical protein SAMN04488594_1547 [Microbacterium azadirachtae]SEF99922.1 hypothetical protein SAMN04488592_1557 [Microbacterium azadirachtae]SFR56610.1 hypothetical protein SAMN04488591_2021 [Microbacterium azadirachtae]